MAHEVETMAYNSRETPWHGLGTPVGDNVGSDEFLKAAGLDWEVEKHPLTVTFPDGETKKSGKFALVRNTDRKILTVTSEGWTPVQNRQVIEFMNEYVKIGGARLETAGSLRGGEVIWGLANLDHQFEVGKGDKIKGYLLMTSHHKVGNATKNRTTSVRVVCANTLAMAESDAGNVNYSQSHRHEFDFEAARAAINNAHEELAAAERRYKTILGLKLSVEDALQHVYAPFIPDDVSSYEKIRGILDNEETMSMRTRFLLDSYKNGPGALPGTGWGVLNGLTHYIDHRFGNSEESRMNRGTLGDFATIKKNAERKLMELAS